MCFNDSSANPCLELPHYHYPARTGVPLGQGIVDDGPESSFHERKTVHPARGPIGQELKVVVVFPVHQENAGPGGGEPVQPLGHHVRLFLQ